MTSFLLGFSICLNVIFILFFILFNKKEDDEEDRKIRKLGEKLYGKKTKFSKKEYEDIQSSIFNDSL